VRTAHPSSRPAAAPRGQGGHRPPAQGGGQGAERVHQDTACPPAHRTPAPPGRTPRPPGGSPTPSTPSSSPTPSTPSSTRVRTPPSDMGSPLHPATGQPRTDVPFRPDIIPPREAPDDTSPGPPSPPEHTNWFSWALESLASAVYAFGFVLMTPQLYINYKVRWRPRTPPPPPPPLLPPCDWLRRRFCSVLIRSPHGIGPLSRTLAPPLSMGYTGGIQ